MIKKIKIKDRKHILILVDIMSINTKSNNNYFIIYIKVEDIFFLCYDHTSGRYIFNNV